MPNHSPRKQKSNVALGQMQLPAIRGEKIGLQN